MLIFLDGPHMSGLLSGSSCALIKTPLIPRLANETLYFLYANYYHPITKRRAY
jgi:hypothetical protein